MRQGFRLNASTGARTSAVLLGALKMAQLSSMSEDDFSKFLKELEGGRIFQLLKTSGAIALSEFPSARYAARKYAGYNLRQTASELPELADGAGDLVALMQGIGQEKFEACFLRDAEMSDVERAEACDITVRDAERLRDFVNRAFIQEETSMSAPAPEAPASRVYSAVAGIEIKDGEPQLAFFNREVWKGRYKVDGEKLETLLPGLAPAERKRVENTLKKIEFADKRKTTLYRALEILVSVQTDYLATGEPGRRRPLSQKTLAKNLEVDPSVINRLISNKSIQMPWGMEAPMEVLLPSSKKVNLERLYAVAAENPGMSDEKLRSELKARHGVDLSRRSIAQYRQDLRLAASGSRGKD